MTGWECLPFLLTNDFTFLINYYHSTPALSIGMSALLIPLIGIVVADIRLRTSIFRRGPPRIVSESERFAVRDPVALDPARIVSVSLAHALFRWMDWTWQTDRIARSLAICMPATTSCIERSGHTFRRH